MPFQSAGRCNTHFRNDLDNNELAGHTSTHSYCFFPLSVSRCRFGGKFFSSKTYIYSLILLVYCKM